MSLSLAGGGGCLLPREKVARRAGWGRADRAVSDRAVSDRAMSEPSALRSLPGPGLAPAAGALAQRRSQYGEPAVGKQPLPP